MESYDVEMYFDNINKIVTICPAGGYGTNRGAYFFENVNINTFAYDSNTEDFANKLICYGYVPTDKEKAAGKTQPTVTVTDNSYLPTSVKTVTQIWSDERYTDVTSLETAGKKKLKELQPQVSFSLTLYDLQYATDVYDDIFKFELGDTVIVSAKNLAPTQQRIIKIAHNEDNPESTEIELTNATRHLQSTLNRNNKLVSGLTNSYYGLDARLKVLE